jgi:hypothetical protein
MRTVALGLSCCVLAISMVAAPGVTLAQEGSTPEGIYRGTWDVVNFDISPPLRDIAPLPISETGPIGRMMADPESDLAGPLGPQDVDRMVQRSVGGERELPAPLTSFDGPSNLAGVSPPDPVGDVGPNHYVAMSNLYFQIYNKTGASLYGPAANNTLWSGFGGDCETDNDGDPIVLYDQLSDRWILTQFTSSGSTYFNCVAVSTSADPTGSYYRYAFSTGTNFPDYPKYGVWPDGLYISTREFANGSSFAGIGAYAIDRAQLVAGNPSPTVVSFLITASAAGGAYNIGDGLLPGDMDGTTPPPAGSPNYYVGSMDNGGQYSAPQDALTLWSFTADFVTPANSTFILTDTIPIASFDTQFSGCSGRSCIPQPGTSTKLDILSYRQRPLHRLAYRNFGTHESLVTNQSVEAATNVAGVRWWEIRDPYGSPFIYQEGTYAPGVTDGVHRWMGSIAMDQSGNMALGYSASNGTSTYPSSWYTGRLADDPLGTMPQGEDSFIDGTGSQTGSSRWGDYTSMNVDPVDDCTFWYVNEYLPTSSSVGWRLRIGSFVFPSCGGGGCTTNPSSVNVTPNGPLTLCAGTGQTLTATATGGSGLSYQWMRDGADIAGATSPTYLANGTGTHSYNCEVTGSGCSSGVTDPSSTAITWGTDPDFGGATAAIHLAGTCDVRVEWDPATPLCSTGVSYNVYRSTTSGFSPGSANRIATCVSGLSYDDLSLSEDTYYYKVRAEDGSSGGGGPCNNGYEDNNNVEVSATVSSGTTTLLDDDFSTLANWLVSTGPGPHTCGDWALSTNSTQRPPNSTGNYAISNSDACGSGSRTSTDMYLTSGLDAGGATGLTLEYDLYYRHYSGDDATVQVWNGSSWVTIWADTNTTVQAHHSWDVTAYANADFKVKFSYQNASYDWWFAVDNVTVIAEMPGVTCP